jgi:hypothetical protein
LSGIIISVFAIDPGHPGLARVTRKSQPRIIRDPR